jgi:hypothetical protein
VQHPRDAAGFLWLWTASIERYSKSPDAELR